MSYSIIELTNFLKDKVMLYGIFFIVKIGLKVQLLNLIMNAKTAIIIVIK